MGHAEPSSQLRALSPGLVMGEGGQTLTSADHIQAQDIIKMPDDP